MAIVLSRDTDKSLCLIYKEYLSRRKNNVDKSNASIFEASTFKTLFPTVNQNDFISDLSELKKNELIKLYIDGSFVLETNAIVYMENRFKNGIVEITDFISKLIP